jgi:hypothetical protein
MSEWITRENVEVLNVFRKIPANHNQYLIQFRMPEPDKPLGESRHSINIWESDLKGQLKGVLDGTRERSYLAYGNQDIDFYKNKEGKFTIRHSPYEGLNLVLILAGGQFEKLVEELSVDAPCPSSATLQTKGEEIKGPRENNILNENEIELLEYMDYQVMNNGMDGWFGNRAYEKINELVGILNKRSSALDQKVATIFIKATVAGVGYFQHKDSAFIPEIKELFDKYEEEIIECGKQYQQVAKDFMKSYGLENYGTKFSKNINS